MFAMNIIHDDIVSFFYHIFINQNRVQVGIIEPMANQHNRIKWASHHKPTDPSGHFDTFFAANK